MIKLYGMTHCIPCKVVLEKLHECHLKYVFVEIKTVEELPERANSIPTIIIDDVILQGANAISRYLEFIS